MPNPDNLQRFPTVPDEQFRTLLDPGESHGSLSSEIRQLRETIERHYSSKSSLIAMPTAEECQKFAIKTQGS